MLEAISFEQVFKRIFTSRNTRVELTLGQIEDMIDAWLTAELKRSDRMFRELQREALRFGVLQKGLAQSAERIGVIGRNTEEGRMWSLSGDWL